MPAEPTKHLYAFVDGPLKGEVRECSFGFPFQAVDNPERVTFEQEMITYTPKKLAFRGDDGLYCVVDVMAVADKITAEMFRDLLAPAAKEAAYVRKFP